MSSSWSMKAVVLSIRVKFSSVQHLPCADVQEMMAERGQREPQLLDTRQGEEFQVSHLPGARHVEFDGRNVSELAKSIDPTRPVVCYCSVGYRSSVVAGELAEHFRRCGEGETKVYNMEGGIFEWACQGRGLVKQAEGVESVADSVHPYSGLWGKLLPSNLRHPTHPDHHL